MLGLGLGLADVAVRNATAGAPPEPSVDNVLLADNGDFLTADNGDYLAKDA